MEFHLGRERREWFGSLYPRLARFLPAENVLEIAPGFGSWTKFLTSAATHFIGVDLVAGVR